MSVFSLDSSRNPALAGEMEELDQLDPALSLLSKTGFRGTSDSRPVKKARRGHSSSSLNSSMDCDNVQKFPTFNLFDLLAKNKDETNSHPDNTFQTPNLPPRPRNLLLSTYTEG